MKKNEDELTNDATAGSHGGVWVCVCVSLNVLDQVVN